MFTAIFAINDDGVFAVKKGDKLELPVFCKEDLKHFSKTTSGDGNTLWMGRGTYEEMKNVKPKGRLFYVVSESLSNQVADGEFKKEEHVVVVHPDDIPDTISKLDKKKEHFVIGGKRLLSMFYSNQWVHKTIKTKFHMYYRFLRDKDTIRFWGSLRGRTSENSYKWMLTQNDDKAVPQVCSVTVSTIVHGLSTTHPLLCKLYYSDNKAPCRTLDENGKNIMTLRLINQSLDYPFPDPKTGYKGWIRLPFTFDRPVLPGQVLAELLWNWKGIPDAGVLAKMGCKVYLPDTSKENLIKRGFVDREQNDMGPAYPFQWRHSGAVYKTMKDSYEGFDQLRFLLTECKRVHDLLKSGQPVVINRRVQVSLAPPHQVPEMTLPPCLNRFNFVFSVVENRIRVDLGMCQRSWDYVLAGPWNKLYGFFMLYLICKWFDFDMGSCHHTINDIHLYENQLPAAEEILMRDMTVVNPWVKLPGYLTKYQPDVDKLLTMCDESDYHARDVKTCGFKQPPRVKIAFNT